MYYIKLQTIASAPAPVNCYLHNLCIETYFIVLFHCRMRIKPNEYESHHNILKSYSMYMNK